MVYRDSLLWMVYMGLIGIPQRFATRILPMVLALKEMLLTYTI